MNKYLLSLLAILLVGCGTTTVSGGASLTLNPHYFSYQKQNWQLNIPSTWEILGSDKNTLFMARNGDENIAILERNLSSQSPSQQIIKSAKNGFFSFELQSQNETQWSFSGQPSTTTPPRTFWQKAQIVANNKFLLASCSQHQNSAAKSSCSRILNSWQVVE